MTNQNIDINFIEDCLKEALFLQGKLSTWNVDKDNTVKKVQEAKNWLEKQPNYIIFLQHLQTMLHQKNIGAFSELLSYFVKDVLDKDKQIVFDLYTYHNLPALRIESLNEGCRENIFEGNGGSIANIVSTGLRLIALSRLTHRRFIILDEPDCWLKPSHVPTFAKIIGDISAQLNIQTIIISHHSWEYFKDYGRVIELKKEGKHLVTNIIHDNPLPESDEKLDIIENINLQRFMSHYDTVFELHPHLTCIVGENDIGKSVITAAMKALSYGDSSDSYIMHHEKEAKILVTLTGNKQILWQRFLKTDQENTQKVKYSLFENNTLILSEYNSSEAPSFVKKELNICTTEDIDIHIGSQKQPVFLLSPDVKPQQRAKILSLGKESLIIQKMMENIKSKTKELKAVEKAGEIRFAELEKLIAVLDNIDTIVESLEQTKKDYNIHIKKSEQMESLIEIVNDLEVITAIIDIKKVNSSIPSIIIKQVNALIELIHNYEQSILLSQIDKIENINTNYKIRPIDSINSIIQELEQSEKISHVEKLSTLTKFELPVNTKQLAEIHRAIEMISTWNKLADVELITSEIKEPTIKSIHEIEQLIKSLEDNQNELIDLEKKLSKTDEWKVELQKRQKLYFDEFGSECPTCGQHITEEHLKGTKHA